MATQGARSVSARDTGTRTGARDHDKTPAQWYCLLAGAALLLAGIVGFIADSGFSTGSDINGDKLLGIFEVNGWHNLVHIASGLLLLAASSRRAPAKTVALVFGLTYGVVALYGLIDGSDVIGLIPINGADNVLHIALAAAGVLAALASPRDDRHDLRTSTANPADETRSGRIRRDEGDGTYDPLSGRPFGDKTRS